MTGRCCTSCLSDMSDADYGITLGLELSDDEGGGYIFCTKDCLVDFVLERIRKESQTCS